MKIKKIFVIVLILLVAFSLGASYIFTGAPNREVSEQGEPGFIGPTGTPAVTGPTAPPPISAQ